MSEEDIIKETLVQAEKIRYQCTGLSSTAECIVYIKSNNEVMIIHDNRTIFHTTIPNYYNVHPEFSYKRSDIVYNDKKEVVLDHIEQLQLFDLHRLNYCRYKYDEYIAASHKCAVVAQEEDLSTNDSFLALYKMRSGDGLKYFKVQSVTGEYIINIPHFVGLYGIKKADKYGITVYNFDSLHFLVKITDKKPKLNAIDIYLCILKGV